MAVRMKALKAHMDRRMGREFTEPSSTRALELEQRGLAVRITPVPPPVAPVQLPSVQAGGSAIPGPLPGGPTGKRKR